MILNDLEDIQSYMTEKTFDKRYSVRFEITPIGFKFSIYTRLRGHSQTVTWGQLKKIKSGELINYFKNLIDDMVKKYETFDSY